SLRAGALDSGRWKRNDRGERAEQHGTVVAPLPLSLRALKPHWPSGQGTSQFVRLPVLLLDSSQFAEQDVVEPGAVIEYLQPGSDARLPDVRSGKPRGGLGRFQQVVR